MLLLVSEALYLVTEVIVVLCVMILICTHTHTHHHAYTQTSLMSSITLVNVLEGEARFYMSSLGDHCFDYCTALKHHPILKAGDISRLLVHSWVV